MGYTKLMPHWSIDLYFLSISHNMFEYFISEKVASTIIFSKWGNFKIWPKVKRQKKKKKKLPQKNFLKDSNDSTNVNFLDWSHRP